MMALICAHCGGADLRPLADARFCPACGEVTAEGGEARSKGRGSEVVLTDLSGTDEANLAEPDEPAPAADVPARYRYGTDDE